MIILDSSYKVKFKNENRTVTLLTTKVGSTNLNDYFYRWKTKDNKVKTIKVNQKGWDNDLLLFMCLEHHIWSTVSMFGI